MVILSVKDNSKDAKAFLEYVKTLSFVRIEDGYLPNTETKKAIEDTQKGIGVKKFDSVEALFEDLDS